MPRFSAVLMFSALIVAHTLMPHHAAALGTDWQKDDTVAVRLITGVDGVGTLATLPFGLEITMKNGWHTYWRSPGAAGLPPQIDWRSDAGSNLKKAELLYPAPKRYTAFGLETIGYRDHVIFPITVTPAVLGQAVNADAVVSVLLCSDTCVPKTFNFHLTVPAGEAQPSAEAAALKQASNQIPTVDPVQDAQLSITAITTDKDIVTFAITSGHVLQNPDIFVENDKDISFTAPEITLSNDKHSARMAVKPADALPEGTTLANMHLTATITDGDLSVEDHVTVPAAANAPPPATLGVPAPAPVPLKLAILFALIGGFILNLMPCVLPVLSLKLLSVIGHGGRHSRSVRISFLTTAAGILFSFLTLAVATIVLKNLGMAVGWGVQFQQPIFLTALIVIVTSFAANMWGLFDIGLPRLIADIAGSRTPHGKHHPKLTGDFVTGAFATLLATPCTAPFLGTAVGFALASGARDILIIFMALGFGMIVPYLTVALFPKIATSLPRPGHWMIRLRYALGGILAATVIWLLWVLAAQVTRGTMVDVALCMVAIILLLALRQRVSAPARYSVIGLAVLVSAAFGFVLISSPADRLSQMPDALWAPFDEKLLAQDVADGKTVFVDVTADWCLTCKANHKFILSQQDIVWQLFHSEVVAMQADWTNPDPAIAAYLHSYGRYGIPFNIVYGPGAKNGIILPELLSKSAVTAALNKAHNSDQGL